MYLNQTQISDFWFERNNTFTEKVIHGYGVWKEVDEALYDRIQKILYRDKKRFYRGIAITTADTDREITKAIERAWNKKEKKR